MLRIPIPQPDFSITKSGFDKEGDLDVFTYYAGEVGLDRRLTDTEEAEIKSLFCDRNRVCVIQNKIQLDEMYTRSIDDVIDALQVWCVDHGITVRDGSWISYYGDYEGRIEWDGGEWNDFSREECAVRDATDESLIGELIRRGYFAITNARLIEILNTYVCNDLESAETDYVREVLCDTCGCTDEELRAVGLECLIPDEEE